MTTQTQVPELRRWLPTEEELRQGLFILWWPARAALALFILWMGLCIFGDPGFWEICKRDARKLLRVRLEEAHEL